MKPIRTLAVTAGPIAFAVPAGRDEIDERFDQFKRITSIETVPAS